jgi:hypothetical protein
MLQIISLASNKYFGLVDIGRTGLEGNATVRRKEDTSTLHGTFSIASI